MWNKKKRGCGGTIEEEGRKRGLFSSLPLNPPRPFRRWPSLLPALFSYLSFLPFSPPLFFLFLALPLPSWDRMRKNALGSREKRIKRNTVDGRRGKGGGLLCERESASFSGCLGLK